jgi:hypothetical protein
MVPVLSGPVPISVFRWLNSGRATEILSCLLAIRSKDSIFAKTFVLALGLVSCPPKASFGRGRHGFYRGINRLLPRASQGSTINRRDPVVLCKASV